MRVIRKFAKIMILPLMLLIGILHFVLNTHGCETALEPDLSPCTDGGSLLPGPVRCELRDRHTGKLEPPSGSVPAFLKTIKRSK